MFFDTFLPLLGGVNREDDLFWGCRCNWRKNQQI